MITRFKSWYGEDQQEFLRREVRWAWRWLWHKPGIYFTIAYLTLGAGGAVFNFLMVLAMSSPDDLHLGYMGGSGLAAGVRMLMKLALWMYVMQTRVFRPFSQGRAESLLLTPLAPRDVWPAFLAAPVVLSAVFACFELAFHTVGVLAPGILQVAFKGMSSSPDAWASLTTLIQMNVGALFPVVATPVRTAGVSAFVAWSAFPYGGYTRVLFSGFCGLILLNLPGWIGMMLIMAGMFALTSSFAGAFDSSQLVIILGVLAAPVLNLGMAALVYMACLRGLRKEKKWRKLRAFAGAE